MDINIMNNKGILAKNNKLASLLYRKYWYLFQRSWMELVYVYII